jgi:uncharacterized protein (TIGR02265 family)
MAGATGSKEEVVYRATVEGLFHKALGSAITPRCRDRIRTAGIDLGERLKPAYLREVFYDCVRILGEELFPKVEPDRRMVQLGTLFMEGYEQTLVGKAALTAAKLMGTRRTLGRMTVNFETANNYMKTWLVEEGPGRARLTLSETSGAPGYFEGAIHRGLTFAGAKELTVRREAYDGHRCTLLITWTP